MSADKFQVEVYVQLPDGDCAHCPLATFLHNEPYTRQWDSYEEAEAFMGGGLSFGYRIVQVE